MCLGNVKSKIHKLDRSKLKRWSKNNCGPQGSLTLRFLLYYSLKLVIFLLIN